MATKRQSGFFAIDQRSFHEVVRLGPNAAAAYLVLSAGTGADNMTTRWSTNAVQKYAGLALKRARAAIELLENKHFLRNDGTRARPHYRIATFDQLHTCGAPGLNTDRQREVFAAIEQGAQPSKQDRGIADGLAKKGLIEAYDDSEKGRQYRLPGSITKSDHAVWLPKELVTGAAGELPPVMRLRQVHDAMVFRLVVDLYAVEDLSEDGGVPRSIIYQIHEREERIGHYGPMVVWAFTLHHRTTSATRGNVVDPHLEADSEGELDWDPLWSRLKALKLTGVIEWVPHLLEADDPDAEILHPLGYRKDGKIAGKLGRAARDAAKKLVMNVIEELDDDRWGLLVLDRIIVPVYQHMEHVQVVGIARLRYQPLTRLRVARFSDYMTNCQHHLAQYRQIARHGLTTPDEMGEAEIHEAA